MRQLIIFLLIFLTIIIESSLTKIPLTLVLVTVLAILLKTKISGFAFLAGLLLDLFLLRPLGADSLLFLFIALLANRYQAKMSTGNILYSILILFLGTVINNLLFLRHFDLMLEIYAIVFGIALLVIFGKFFPDLFFDRKKLAV